MTGMEHAIEQAARALWDYDNADQTPEWRDMAWNDMGGSEPCVGYAVSVMLRSNAPNKQSGNGTSPRPTAAPSNVRRWTSGWPTSKRAVSSDGVPALHP